MTTWASPTAGLISQQGTPVPPNRLHTSPPNPPQIDLPNCWYLSELAECWCGGPGHGGPGRAPPDPAQAGEHYAAGKVILRTVLPENFENEWSTGGDCVHKHPFWHSECQLGAMEAKYHAAQVRNRPGGLMPFELSGAVGHHGGNDFRWVLA